MDIEKIVAQLREEIGRLSQAIGLLEGDNPTKARVGRPPAAAGRSTRPQRKGGLTPAGRRKLSEAMKRRWAQRRGATGASSPRTSGVAAAKPKKRGGITAAGRRRLSKAMKKRWAQRRRKGV